jgi:hypothetical protein
MHGATESATYDIKEGPRKPTFQTSQSIALAYTPEHCVHHPTQTKPVCTGNKSVKIIHLGLACLEYDLDIYLA